MSTDLRHALRLLARQPGFTAAACATLALAIGANIAIFSVVDAALFRPVPYRDPERLVDIIEVTRRGTPEETRASGMPWDRVADWRAQSQLFEGVATYGSARRMLVGTSAGAAPSRVGRLSPGFLRFLGVAPTCGREFAESDRAGDDRVAILSSAFWHRTFSGDPAALGQTIFVDRQPYIIIGVAPPTFRFLVDLNTDLWILQRDGPDGQGPGSSIARIVARVRAGLTIQEAETELDRAAQRMQQQRPASQKWDVDLDPIGGRRQTHMASTLLVLLGAVCFVLLIACANVANLLLSRTLTRQREVAIRGALGATRLQLVRQFLFEGFALAAVGGLAGMLLAWWGTTVIPALVPARLQYALFGVNPLTMDGRLLDASLLCVALTGLLCSAAPAFRAAHYSQANGLTGSHLVGVTDSGRRLRQVFLVAQVGLTLVLVAGSGLLIKSFVRMVSVDPGFDIDRLGSIALSLSTTALPERAQQEAIYAALLERVRALPGIEAAEYGTAPPDGLGGRFVIERAGGAPVGLGAPLSIHSVNPSYFSVTGVPVRAGRAVGPEDRDGATPVALVDETTVQRAWPGVNPIGQRFRYSPLVPWITVVGVAGRVKTGDFMSPSGDAQVYLPIAQSSSTGRRLLVRSARPAAAVANAIKTVPLTHPALAVESAGVVADAYDATLSAPHFYLVLMAALAGVALVTAAVGLYAVLACAVGQRTREIGLRIALGADRRRVMLLMLRGAYLPVLAGIVAGLVGALWLTKFLGTLLYQVTPLDPPTFAAAVACLLGVSAVAAIVPVRRATRVDPLTALKSE